MTVLPEYDNPPINEVGLGCRFVPIAALTLPLVGAFWASIRKDFPHTEHAIPVGDATGNVVLDEKTNLPWPRIWLLSENRDKLIQIQRDRFVLNWRRKVDGGEYPRYPHLIQEFTSNLDRFVKFLEDDCEKSDIAVESCEATYVNHIVLDGPLEDMGMLPAQIFNGNSWLLPSDLGTPTGFNWINVYQLADGLGQLTIRAAPARMVEDRKPVLVLELNVQGNPSESGPDAMKQWFGRAHDVIVRGFSSITSPDIQRSLWGRK